VSDSDSDTAEVDTPAVRLNLDRRVEQGALTRLLMPNPRVHPRAGRTVWQPEQEANWFSRLTFSYLTPLIDLGYVQPLVREDLPDVADCDASRLIVGLFDKAYEETATEEHPRGLVLRGTWRAVRREFVIAGLWKVVQDALQLLAPVFLEQLLINVQRGGPTWKNGAWCAGIFVLDLVRMITQNIYFHGAFRTGMHVKTGLIASIFDKSLRVSGAVRGEMGVGKIVNLQSNDASKIYGTAQFLHQIWSAPAQVLVTIGLLVRVLGIVPAAVGLLTTIIFIPINMAVGKRIFAYRRKLIGYTDKRVKMVTEVLSGIKAIKLYAWEQPYLDRVGELRDDELRMIIKTGLFSLINIIVFYAGPVIVAMTSFIAFVGMGDDLTAAVAFPALALFNLLRFPIIMLPMIINQVINAKVAGTRLQAFFDADEADPAPPLPLGGGSGPSEGLAVRMAGARFQWGAPPPSDKAGGGTGPRGGPPGGASSRGGGAPGAKAPGKTMSRRERRDAKRAAKVEKSAIAKAAEEAQRAVKERSLARDQSMIQRNLAGTGGPDRGVVGAAPASAGAAANVAFSAGDAANAAHNQDASPAAKPEKKAYEGFAVDINLDVRQGELLMIVGEVGSGKTSLLMGLLREMEQKGGEVEVYGSLAYTAQDPWIQNATLRANVLMGDNMDEERYEQALVVCALEADLSQLPGADATEIGEKGVNLSGGQKHRVALARAVYADADVYLLDDPLSAVDAHVGAHIFEQCFVGALAEKTRILVTHQLQFLGQADRVAVVEKGRVVELGTYDDLVAKGVSFTKYELHQNKNRESKQEGGEGAADADGKPMKRVASKHKMTGLVERTATMAADRSKRAGGGQREGLVKAENRAVGSVKLAVYGTYLTAWGPYFIYPFLAVLSTLLDRGLQSGQTFWLAIWSNDVVEAEIVAASGGTFDINAWRYVLVYSAFGLASVVFTAIRSVFIVFGSNNASRNLGNTLLEHVIRLPMSFFDSNPLGRLLNRFTADIDAIDTGLQQTFSSAITTFVNVLAAIILMMIVTPEIGVAIAILGVFYWRVQRIYVTSSREIKRLDAISLSPIFSLFGETSSGLPTVRAFRKQDQLRERNLDLIDASNRAYWPHMSINRWLSMRLESLGNLITTLSAVVVTVISPADAGFVGLVISSAMSITGVMNWLVRQVSELEVAMNAVERITEYCKLDTEAPPVIDDSRPPAGWPSAGAIEIKGLEVRYRPELDLVLKGLDVSIQAREKVGVCGRTGCGKSTLMLSIYRIVEPSAGTVSIDGLDIGTIGLHDLRNALALVPQDPVLFSGTIRSNLDPFNAVVGGDARLREALERVHLWDAVEDMDGGLDANVSEAGGNLSVGQRQLLCMARALLRDARILLLDEATSSVDQNTDGVIQATIRDCFDHCTVLTIAHRLNSIIDSDTVLVLDNGLLVEADAPAALLRQPESFFAKLVQATSPGSAASLRAQAEAAEAAKALKQDK